MNDSIEDKVSKSSIVFVGDMFPTEQNVGYFSRGDISTLFGAKICQLFSDADFRVCNLEGALTDHAEACVKTGPVKIAPISAVKAYKKIGIDCCLLANNHVTDGGHQGVIDTMHALGEVGIKYIGAGSTEKEISHYLAREVGGVKVGIYNVCETMYNKPTRNKAGAWLYDEYIVCNEIRLLRQECDYLVVIYHGGIEKYPFPSPEIRKRFYRMVDNGANAIVSQHTHCIGCEEKYNGSYLLYGQGDFLLKNFAPGLTDTGLIVELVVENRQVNVKKHLVHSEDNLFVRYSEKQDFFEFEERSTLLNDKEYIDSQFNEFCYRELRLYLEAFKSPSKLTRLKKRLFTKMYYRWLYNRAYTMRDFLFTLHTMRSEQNRETAIRGMEYLLMKDIINE